MTEFIDHIIHDVVHVHVDNTEELTRVVATEEVEPEHFVCSTYVLATAGGGANVGGGGSANPRNDIQQILPIDPERKDAGIFAVDGPIVLCDTYRKAQDPANQVAGVPFPQGAYVPAGGNASVSGTGPMWAVSTIPSTACRVTVMINRRGAAK